MSKSNSNHFTGTSGAGRALIDEVVANGYKISPDDVLLITRDSSGKIIWLETGSDKAGLKHILKEHGHQFNGKGLSNDDIPPYILTAISRGQVVGTQGKRNPRTVYEFEYNGSTHRVAVQVSENGFIVGANPKSMKEKNYDK